jgi:DNA-binding response OmpR family regulator
VDPVRVLVVDDDDALLNMMSLHLRKKGFQVECAKDGLEAVQVLRTSGPFNVMVTDLMMPGLSGLELLRRARKLDPLLEVIVITAAGSIEMAISALRESGAYDYLTKPLGMIGELSLAVERAANHRELRLERESMRGSLANGARRLEEILTSTGIAIVAANERNELVVASPAAVNLLSQRPENGKPQEGQIPAIMMKLLRGWETLGKNRLAWVEVDWPNGKTKLVRLAPLQLGDSTGWVMVVRDITYMKKLETFIFRDFAKVATQIRQPMERAEMVLAELEKNLDRSDGNPEDQIQQLRELCETVQDGSKDLFTLNNIASAEEKSGEVVPLAAFLKKMEAQQGASLVSNPRLLLKWELADEVPEKMLDHSVLVQLFHHLLQHAELRSREPGELKFSHWAKEESLWFIITDTRTGAIEMDFNTSPLLLDGSKLRQLDRAQIEFAVVKSLVKELGGQVWISQTEGGGLVIAIRFRHG